MGDYSLDLPEDLIFSDDELVMLKLTLDTDQE